MKKLKLFFILPCLLLSGCAFLPGWYRCSSLSGWCKAHGIWATSYWRPNDAYQKATNDCEDKYNEGQSMCAHRVFEVFDLCKIDKETAESLDGKTRAESKKCLEANGLVERDNVFESKTKL